MTDMHRTMVCLPADLWQQIEDAAATAQREKRRAGEKGPRVTAAEIVRQILTGDRAPFRPER